MWRVKVPLPVKGAPLYIFLMFLDALAIMFIAPIIPLYMRQFVSSDAFVGYIFALNSVILIIATLLMDVFLKYVPKLRFLKIGLFGYFVSFFFFPLVKSLPQLLVLSFIRMFLSTAVTVTIGLLVRDSVKKSGIGKTEGYFFTFLNVAALVGPTAGGIFAAEFGYNWTFIGASVFTLLALLALLVRKPYEVHVPQSDHDHFLENVRDFFKNRNLAIVFCMSIGIAFFWTLIYTYMPLFLESGGWSSARIGYAFSIFVIPLLLLEVVVGKWTDRFGAKRFFITGFMVMGVFTGLAYLNFVPTFLVVMLFFATVGAAFVEPIREAFLFKNIKMRDEVRFYTIYATAFSVGSMIGPLLFSSVLLITGYPQMFLFAAILLVFFAILAVIIREKNHNHENSEAIRDRASGAEGVPMVSDRV